MISPSRVFCGLSTFHRHFMTEMFFVSIRSQQCMKLLPTRYIALNMSSVTHLSNMLDREYSSINFKHYKSHNGRNHKGEMCFNQQQTAKFHTRRHVETETDFSQSDPDTFGTLKVNKETPIEAIEGDEGDKEEEIYLEHVPSAVQKLSNKQYGAMIKDFINQKKLADAIDVLETRMLKEDRVKPENFIYTLIIGECGRLGYTKKAFQLYNQMKKRALKVTASVYTGLFNACANSPWPNDGLKHANHLRQLMFEKGYEPNASNYHAMIKAFGRCGDLSTAFTLVDEMAEKKVPISDETFNFLLQACITDKEAGFRHALLVWRKMLQNKVKPGLFTYNLLLRCVRDCGIGDVHVTQDVFHRITEEGKRQGCQISKPRTLLTAGNEDSVQQLPHSEREQEIDEASLQEVSPLENRPNLLAARPHFGNIIALTEVTKPEDRLILVGGCSGLLEQMNKHGVKPNIKTFTQLLDTIPSTRAAEQALLAAMEKAEVCPDIDFYNMLIRKRSMRFDYVNAHAVLKLIQRSGLYPDIVTFGVLALGCRTKQEAQCLLADMRDSGFRMNSEILGAMLRQGCCHFNFEYVLAIMETVIEEEVEPSEKFLEHLENFHKNCQRKIRNKDTDMPQMDKTGGRNYFRRGFQKFCKRYTSWLKEIVPEKLGHPWDQFQKKAQTDKSTVKEGNISEEPATSVFCQDAGGSSVIQNVGVTLHGIMSQKTNLKGHSCE